MILKSALCGNEVLGTPKKLLVHWLISFRCPHLFLRDRGQQEFQICHSLGSPSFSVCAVFAFPSENMLYFVHAIGLVKFLARIPVPRHERTTGMVNVSARGRQLQPWRWGASLLKHGYR